MLAPPVEEIVTVGVGFAMASSAAENSTTQPEGQELPGPVVVTVVTHRSPSGSKASPSGVLGKCEMVVWGVGAPDMANWLFVYS